MCGATYPARDAELPPRQPAQGQALPRPALAKKLAPDLYRASVKVSVWRENWVKLYQQSHEIIGFLGFSAFRAAVRLTWSFHRWPGRDRRFRRVAAGSAALRGGWAARPSGAARPPFRRRHAFCGPVPVRACEGHAALDPGRLDKPDMGEEGSVGRCAQK